MTKEQILKKAIKKAVKNGCKAKIVKDWIETSFVLQDLDETDFHLYYGVIFSHDFAKAFWGKNTWDEHLKEMVLQEEPLKYLEMFL